VTSESDESLGEQALQMRPFADSAKCVGIMLDDSDVVFTPTLNGGYRRRFLNLKTKIRCQPIEKEVAAALIAAFDACE
jgi:hypothetical protein